MTAKEDRERERFEEEVVAHLPKPDGRGADPAAYDLNAQQRREVAKQIAAGSPPSSFALHRREINNKAGRVARAQRTARERKRRKPAERARAKDPGGPPDSDGRRRLAHNPLGPDDPAMVYYRLPGGSILSERKPTGSVSVRLTVEDLEELDRMGGRRDETRAAYAARVLAGHARGLRNARKGAVAAGTPGAQPPIRGQQQLV